MTRETALAQEPVPQRGRQLLAAELKELLAESGLHRATARRQANKLLQKWRVEAPLSEQRVSELFVHGKPGSNFRQLWALVGVMLVAKGVLTEEEVSTARYAKRPPEADTTQGPPAPHTAVHRPPPRPDPRPLVPGAADRWWSYWYRIWELADAAPGPKPDPHLGAYLRAALRAAEEHPYPQLFDAPRSAPTDGYVPQRVTVLSAPGSGPAQDTLLPATDLFTAEGAVRLLTAGPGGGKSTLLRVHVTEEATRMADRGNRRRDGTVPVLVRASRLPTDVPLADALATAVGDALSPYLSPGTLTADFFRKPPYTKEKWLVLVDGLDEVPQPGARAALLHRLAEAANEGPYRVVVTTRPLRPEELDASAVHPALYELLSFTDDDVRGYVRTRFTDRADPELDTAQFAAWMADTHLQDLARTPLIAAMLCRIYLDNPGFPPPDGRTAVYTDFVELIDRRNPHKQIRETHQRAIDALLRDLQRVPDREAVTAAAEAALRALPDIVGHLAHRLLHASDTTVDDALADHEHGRPPAPVQAADWTGFLTELLLPTGLLTLHGGQLDFPHRTFQEYHAARYVTEHPRDRAAAIRTILDSRWIRLPFTRRIWTMSVAKPSLRAMFGRAGASFLTRADMSYVGFVLDLAAGTDGIDLGRKLHRIADQGGVEGGTFVALQAALGTKVPAEAAEAARTTLVDVALGSGRGPGEQRVLAAETLSRLGDERGLTALTALAEDPDLLDAVDPLHRDAPGPTFMSPSLELWDGDGGGVSFARRRSRLDTARKLTAVMRDPTLDPAVRREAARVRRAFGRLIKDPDLTAEGPADGA
ncbi:hypothetical protein STAFG_0152 [Streptomyces afghaniensis 772]|uniref:NACHT domain-containing protein n=1 Tax=Streptomyces afghaniensis 772 TaxID=1283301 RepID=S4N489_9ACTN|nr:NACHT domain-containing protein [Streptomyces afghaniensis]EPJ42797.1 hypothetical protein STAFG_0152 [Streptomyces afghaniensis 772]